MGIFHHLFSYLNREPSFKELSSEDKIGKIDPGALAILRALTNAGFEGYAVGGCVRDLLLGKVPHDWDITTSAKPKETMKVLQDHGWKSIDGGGRRFGTVIGIVQGRPYEITTFRREFYGADSHRPAKVTFADSLKEDLERRDFTVNAMALDEYGLVYDYFGGQSDLDHKILRTVGNATERFQEDALRMFRACRFLGQLGFMADSSLVDGMSDAFDRVRGLSLERVKGEMEELLVSPHAAKGLDLLVRSGLNETSCRVKRNGTYYEVPVLPELSHLVGLPQMKQFHKYDGWYHTLAVVQHASPVLLNRWAALLHDVGKGMPGIRSIHDGKITDYGHDKKGAEMAGDILTRWEYPPKFIKRVVWLVANHMKYHYFANVPEADVVKWVRRLARSGEFSSQKDLHEAVEQMTDLTCADIIGCGEPETATEGHRSFAEYMEKIIDEIPVTSKELHYDKRVPEVLGAYVKDGMQNLLLRVQNGALKNDEDSIYEAAVKFRRRRDSEISKS